MASIVKPLAWFAAGAAAGTLLARAPLNHGPRALERHLQEAIRRDEFTVLYQPIVHLGDGRCSGVEALLRWRNGHGMLISPDTFMAVALETGLIEPITEKVIERVATDMIPLWDERPEFHVGINVPPGLLGCGRLVLVAERCGLIPYIRQIVIEITETSIVDDLSRQAIILARAMRARVAIDDFGTGSNELAQLQDLEIDFIKVDQSFVRRLCHHQQATKFVEWIVGLTHDIGAQAIAEGVETQEQADFLKTLGVEMVQGYLYAKPLSMEDLRVFLARCPAD